MHPFIHFKNDNYIIFTSSFDLSPQKARDESRRSKYHSGRSLGQSGRHLGQQCEYTVVISLNPGNKLDEKEYNSADGRTQQESHPFSFFFIKV